MKLKSFDKFIHDCLAGIWVYYLQRIYLALYVFSFFHWVQPKKHIFAHMMNLGKAFKLDHTYSHLIGCQKVFV